MKHKEHYAFYIILVLSLHGFSTIVVSDDNIQIISEKIISNEEESKELDNRSSNQLTFKPLVNNHGSIGLINNKTARFAEVDQ